MHFAALAVVGFTLLARDSFAGGFYREEAENRRLTGVFDGVFLESELRILDQQLVNLAKKFGTERSQFKNLRCAANLKVTPTAKQPRINIVYEEHGTAEMRATMKAVLDEAVKGRALALLESDTGRDSFALRRTLNNYGFNNVEPKNIFGIDSDLRARTLWFADIFIHDLEDNLEKKDSKEAVSVVAQNFAEELLHNSRMREMIANGRWDSPQAKAAAEYYSKFLSVVRATPQGHVVAITRLLGLVPKSDLQLGEFNALLREMREKSLPLGVPYVRNLGWTKNLDEVVMNTGFNKRDEAFLDSIGEGVCQALEKKVDTINVVIGAGHRESVIRRLKGAFSAIGAPAPDIETFNAQNASAPNGKGVLQPAYMRQYNWPKPADVVN